MGPALGYEASAAPVLEAFDQKIQAQQAALAQQQKVSALATAAAKTASARHVASVLASRQQQAQSPSGALPGEQESVGTKEDDGQGAFTPPAKGEPQTLSDYLKQHDDDTFTKANAELKQKTGKSADEMYDQLVANKFITPAEQELTTRQKSEALAHIGLEMLKNSQSRNSWTTNPAGAFGAGGEAGLASIEKSQQENQQQAANRAHEEYLKEQDIGLKQAGAKAQAEREDEVQAGQDTRQSSRDRREVLEKEYEEQQENARTAAEIAERHADRAATKSANLKTMVDNQGLQHELHGNVWVLSKDEKGNTLPPVQRSAEDQARAQAVIDATADRRARERDAYEKSVDADVSKDLSLAGDEKGQAAAKAARMQAYDANHQNQGQRVAPQAALDYLGQHPEARDAFKAKYGYLPE